MAPEISTRAETVTRNGFLSHILSNQTKVFMTIWKLSYKYLVFFPWGKKPTWIVFHLYNKELANWWHHLHILGWEHAWIKWATGLDNILIESSKRNNPQKVLIFFTFISLSCITTLERVHNYGKVYLTRSELHKLPGKCIHSVNCRIGVA